MMRLAAALFCLVLLLPAGARAQALSASLSSDLIGITTGFTGGGLVLFGATDGPGDIIVVVRGPDHDVVVRRKARVAGIWLNTRRTTFLRAPGYYAVFSSHPLDKVVPAAVLAQEHVGLANLRLATLERRTPEETEIFRSALFAAQQRDGLYASAVREVHFLGERLFRADIDVPANLPIGTYSVEVLLVRKQAIAAAETLSFDVSQIGVDAAINDFATRWAWLYGAIAVLGAGMAGWLASLPFRNA
jgi:uncharacterized protein (TIGR02186 family)